MVTSGDSLPTLADVTQAEWDALARRRIFFGHQSVGANVVQGLVEVLAEHPEIDLEIVESRDLASADDPGLYHAKVGRNRHPDEKLEEFSQLLGAAASPAGAVGFLKFCYVDVTAETDPRALFDDYRRRMAAAKAANPGVTIVHFTMPLRTDEGWFRSWLQRLRSGSAERDRNVIRNRYNALVRETYGGSEPVFDLANLEARGLDGEKTGFVRDGQWVQTLAPELSSDGGHLNEIGRRVIAEQLMVFLAKLPE